jgi:hypothetical protein
MSWLGARTRASCVGSEHSRKEPSRQLIRWLFGTPVHDEAGTTTTTSSWLPQCRCIAHGLLSVEGKYSLLPISFGLTLLPE